MFKNMPLIFFIFLLLSACAHNNIEDHFKESKTGWTKERVFKRFGQPDESFEDSDFKYYVYSIKKKSKGKSKSPIVWNVRYVFEHNKVVDVIEERLATSDELDKLSPLMADPKVQDDKNSL
jgi:hypothetical protein